MPVVALLCFSYQIEKMKMKKMTLSVDATQAAFASILQTAAAVNLHDFASGHSISVARGHPNDLCSEPSSVSTFFANLH
jgi:hypothetical protein